MLPLWQVTMPMLSNWQVIAYTSIRKTSYHRNPAKLRIRETWVHRCPISVEFHRQLCSRAANSPVIFHRDLIISTNNLVDSSHRKIRLRDVLTLNIQRPWRCKCNIGHAKWKPSDWLFNTIVLLIVLVLQICFGYYPRLSGHGRVIARHGFAVGSMTHPTPNINYTTA